jgi:hypothetical protein
VSGRLDGGLEDKKNDKAVEQTNIVWSQKAVDNDGCCDENVRSQVLASMEGAEK